MELCAIVGVTPQRRRRPPIAALLSLCVICVLGSEQPRAATLAPPGIVGVVNFNFQPPPSVDIQTFGSFPLAGPGGFLQATVSGLPSPAAAVEAAIVGNFFGRASILLRYQMQILGPTASVPVSIQVSGGAAGSSNPADPEPFAGFAVKSFWSLEDVDLGFVEVYSEGIESGTLRGAFSETFSHTVDLTLTANHVYSITMIADAGARAGHSSTSASAFIDPVFSFGPGVGPEYSFEFSEGIGNSPVPLPGALALLGAGLGILSRLRRRS